MTFAKGRCLTDYCALTVPNRGHISTVLITLPISGEVSVSDGKYGKMFILIH